MPDDNRMRDQSDDTPLDPPGDLIARSLGRDVPADSRWPTAPNALSNIAKADHDALVKDEEMLAEARNEMPRPSASKAPTRWRRIWHRQILAACLFLIATDVLRDPDAAELELREEESQEAREQEEYDRIVNEHDDPLERTIAIGEYYMKKTDAPEAQRAFADRELLERLRRVDQQSRKLDGITPDNAFIREPVGAVLNVAPDILSIVAWLTGSGEAADELHRQSQEFQLARRQLRQGAQLAFYDDGSKPTGTSPPATPGSSEAQPQTEPSATPQVEDAPPRTAEELLEERVLASPLMERALALTRTEELIAAGVDPTKASEQARQEQEGRAATRGSSVAQPQTERSATPQAEDAPPRTAEELFARASSSVVRINVRDAKFELIGVGSGFFVRDDSTIVTNVHVIEGAHSAEVVLQDGTQFEVSEAESFDEQSDVAILHVVHDKTKKIRPLTFALELPAVASKAYVIGAPAGLDNSFSEGSVSGHREISDRQWIQTTAPISPGSSGSPVFNERGLVIGMATMSRVVGQNLNFAIASRHIQEMLHNGGKKLPVKLTELPSRKQPPKPPVVDLPPRAERDIFETIAGEALEASYLSGDDEKRAMRDILRRLESVPDEEKQKVGYWITLSSIHFLNDRPQLQMDAAETAVRLHAKDKRAWVNLDFALQRPLPRNWERLLAVRQQIIQLEAYVAKARDFASLGEAFMELGRYDEAVVAYGNALVRDSEDWYVWDGLGDVYTKEKQFRDAEGCYRKAIEFASADIESLQSYLGLAECYKKMRDFREAIRAYEKALELWPIGQLEHIEEQIRDELPQLRRQARE